MTLIVAVPRGAIEGKLPVGVTWNDPAPVPDGGLTIRSVRGAVPVFTMLKLLDSDEGPGGNLSLKASASCWITIRLKILRAWLSALSAFCELGACAKALLARPKASVKVTRRYMRTDERGPEVLILQTP